jgi:lipopolysaccharide biosynthesis glycosyltransferase
MMGTLKIHIGYDKIEQLAYNVFCYSLNKYSTKPLSISQINLDHLTTEITRPRHPKQSNDFAFSRFLVPYLNNYKGWALFTDNDFLSLSDISKLFELCDDDYAVMCVKHDYTPTSDVKYLGKENAKYQRKNWSSCVLWNCGHKSNRMLTPELINQLDTDDFNVGLYLHRFEFLEDDQIGEIPAEWNHLVGVYDHNKDAKLVHWTNYGPWLTGHESVDYAGDWYRHLYEMLDIKRK